MKPILNDFLTNPIFRIALLTDRIFEWKIEAYGLEESSQETT